MSRLPAAALAALLLLPGAVRAQAQAPAAPAAPKDEAVAAPRASDAEIDARTREAIQKAVEKAKEELRDEVRAEIQGAQSAAEFMGAVAEGPKLEFLQLDGYLPRARPALRRLRSRPLGRTRPATTSSRSRCPDRCGRRSPRTSPRRTCGSGSSRR